MLTIYDTTGHSLLRHNDTAPTTKDTVWFDLLHPTPEEDRFVEKTLGISVPTRAEMREIEASSRFYQEGGATYMTAFIVHNIEAEVPTGSTVTFILAGNSLVTVRYADPKAFPLFLQRVAKGDAISSSGAAIMIGLIEALIERTADLIEFIQERADKFAEAVFDVSGARRKGERKLEMVLKGTGTQGDTVARALESATSLERVLHFFETAACERNCDAKVIQRIQTAQKDINSLQENMHFLSGRMTFLLDATLGMIANEQNQIIKLFSVMAVMLMPPTLVASVYGMNFRHMPELEWLEGYPMAIGLMFLSALIPFLYFRRKRWL
jgi:magnesium transporter